MENAEHPEWTAESRSLRKWTIFVLVGMLIAVATVVTLWLSSPQMPEYGGRTAEQWLTEVYSTNRVAALHAFREMEPESVPFLIRVLRRKETTWHKFYRQIYRVVPKSVQKRLPSPVPRVPLVVVWNAAQAALINDRGARTALPQLVRMLQQKGIPSHNQIAGVIVSVAGPGDESCVPGLARCLRDNDPGIRQTVATALNRFGHTAKAAVPELTAALNDPSPDAQIQIAWALWNIDRQTNACATALKAALQARPSSSMEGMAVTYLMQIDPGDSAVLPVLLGMLRGPDEYPAMRAALMLSKYTGRVPEATPILIHWAQTGGPDVRKAALAALKNIDPEAAAKYKH